MISARLHAIAATIALSASSVFCPAYAQVLTTQVAYKAQEGACRKAGDCRFDPSHQAPLKLQSAGLSVSVAPWDGERLGLFLQRNGQSRRIDLPDTIVQIDRLDYISGINRIVVTGMANALVSSVVIVDATQDRVLDAFLGYAPSLAPSGRFLAFIKFYPGHFAEGVSDIYQVYDLRQSPAQNRAPKTPLDDNQDVGLSVYPPDASSATAENVSVEDDKQHRLLSKGFAWRPGRDEFSFIDRATAEPSTARLVAIDLAGSPKAALTERTIALSCDAGDAGCAAPFDIAYRSGKVIVTRFGQSKDYEIGR